MANVAVRDGWADTRGWLHVHVLLAKPHTQRQSVHWQ
jgi:hypothetical protein